MTDHPIPLEALAAHLGVVGKTGSGKSFMARGLVERLLDEGRRVCIVDPTGVWWGLKSDFAGEGPGYPVAIFGGDHADVPLSVGAAGALAEIVAARNFPAIIDISDFTMTERYQFGEAFFRVLHRHNRQPLHLVIDEADELARQQPMPEQRRVLHEVDRLVRRGRVRGFRILFITQRPAVLHKNVLTQANALVMMRLPAPQDRKAVEEWVKGQADEKVGRKLVSSLSGLKQGEGWFWAPEIEILERAVFPMIRTFDSMRAPGDGEEVAEPVNVADVDLSEIRHAFAEAEAEAAENDPKALRARIAELERRAKQGIDAAAVAAARQEGWKEGVANGRLAGMQMMMGRVDNLLMAETKIQQACNDFRETVDGMRKLMKGQPHAVSSPAMIDHQPAASQPSEDPGRLTVDTNAELGPERRILKVLAQQHPARVTDAQWATLAQMKRTGGTWSTYKSRLRTRGLVEQDGGLWGCTDAGFAAAGSVDPVPSDPAALLEMWCAKKAIGGAGRLLRLLVERGPMTRLELANAADMTVTGGTFGTYLSRLRSNGLIRDGAGYLEAAPELVG